MLLKKADEQQVVSFWKDKPLSKALKLKFPKLLI